MVARKKFQSAPEATNHAAALLSGIIFFFMEYILIKLNSKTK
jgi:hypothetical protein